jgi:uncharacterized protein involved in exopolysaccharide biosynthesis
MSTESTYPAPAPRAPLPVVVSELRPAEAKSHFALTIFKWHVLILSFAVVLTVAAAVAMVLRPNLPSATARILVKTGPDTLPVAGLPTAARSSGQEFLQTEAELLGSRIVLLPVARHLRAQNGQTVNDSALDSEVSSLREDLIVSVVPSTTVIQARMSAFTEAEAERKLAMIIDSYMDQHATAYSGSTSLSKFFEHETGTAAAQLRDAEDRLHRWQEANNVTDPEEQLRTQIAFIGEFEASLRRTEVDMDATRVHIDTLTRHIAALPPESVTSREQAANPLIGKLKADIATEEALLGDPSKSPVTERIRVDIAAAEVAARDTGANPLVAKLKSDLVTAELALNDLRQRYTGEDRRVQEKLEQIERLRHGIVAAERDAAVAANERAGSLRQELVAAQRDAETASREKIAGLRAQLATAEREGEVFSRTTLGLNPLRESLNRDLATARARLTTLASQRDGLRDQLHEARNGLAHLQGTRVEAERIAREVEFAKTLYLQNIKRLDDARVTTGLRRQQLTNIAVIEPPRGIGATLSPKRVVLVSLLGAIVGLGLGVATALALEFFNWSLRTPEDVEFYLGVPALASVPAIAGSTRQPELLPALDARERQGER